MNEWPSVETWTDGRSPLMTVGSAGCAVRSWSKDSTLTTNACSAPVVAYPGRRSTLFAASTVPEISHLGGARPSVEGRMQAIICVSGGHSPCTCFNARPRRSIRNGFDLSVVVMTQERIPAEFRSSSDETCARRDSHRSVADDDPEHISGRREHPELSVPHGTI